MKRRIRRYLAGFVCFAMVLNGSVVGAFAEDFSYEYFRDADIIDESLYKEIENDVVSESEDISLQAQDSSYVYDENALYNGGNDSYTNLESINRKKQILLHRIDIILWMIFGCIFQIVE